MLSIYGVAAAGLIIALVEMAKRSFGLTTRYAAPLALALGLILAAFVKLEQPDVGTWLQVELSGALAGLSASGLYSGQKALRE